MFFLTLGFIFITLLASGVFLFTLNFFPPYVKETNNLIVVNLFYFFTSLWVAIAGLSCLMLYSLRTFSLRGKRKKEIEAIHLPKQIFKQSLRQGLLLATGITGIGLLHLLKFSNPLNIVLVISVLILIEVYFFGH